MVTKSGFYKKLGGAAAGIVLAASVAAVPVIKKWEGRSLTPYVDIAGVLTYCDGETLNVDPNKTYTHKECDALTQRRALQFAQGVANRLEYPISQKTFEGHTVLAYNIGLGNYGSSSALRLTNEGKLAEGCEAFMRFACITVRDKKTGKPLPGAGDKKPVKATLDDGTTAEFHCVNKDFSKRFVRGLANRRNDERKICLAGIE